MKTFTVKEISAVVGVSLPTVRNKISELKIKEVGKRGKALVYSLEDAEKICGFFGKNFSYETIIDGADGKEKEKKTKENEKKKEKDGKAEEPFIYEGLSGSALVDFLFEELKRKEKENDFLKEQIEKKDTLIESLNNKNDFLMAQQMGLALPQTETAQPKKENFFKRLFRKRDKNKED